MTDDLPPDPDRDDVPPDLAALDGKQVTVTETSGSREPEVEPDGTTTTATLVVAPGLWGHARRIREHFYDNGPGAA